jgi:predicted metal-dependent phosphoesterase TrpH
MSRIDLHMHSAYSLDADLPVSDLLERCVTNGVSTLAVTDHNSVHSVAEARVIGREKGLTILSGIEIDCAFQGNNYHLLGYGFSGDLADFDGVETAFNTLQADTVPHKLAKLRALGIAIDDALLYQRAGVNIPHEELMAELILDDERNTAHPLLSPYRAGGARSGMPYVNFFWDFFAAGQSCHTPVAYPALPAMVELIRANRGIPVIAHLGANVKQGHCTVLDEMRKAGVMGVEVFSNYHAPELAAQLYDYATGNGLHVTCGSDFHGRNKPAIELGDCAHPAAADGVIETFVAAAQSAQ